MGIFMIVLMTVTASLISIFIISHYSKHSFLPVSFVEYPAHVSFRNQKNGESSFTRPLRSQIKVRLSVLSGPKRGMTITLREPRLMIERQSNKLSLEDALISRHHALLKHQDGMWFIQDLDSTNGTTLNDKALIPRRLASITDGSILQVGNTRIAFSQLH